MSDDFPDDDDDIDVQIALLEADLGGPFPPSTNKDNSAGVETGSEEDSPDLDAAIAALEADLRDPSLSPTTTNNNGGNTHETESDGEATASVKKAGSTDPAAASPPQQQDTVPVHRIMVWLSSPKASACCAGCVQRIVLLWMRTQVVFLSTHSMALFG